jgi:hypothetical protein
LTDTGVDDHHPLRAAHLEADIHARGAAVDALIAGLSGGWLDDLVGTLDPVELGFEGVATAAARLVTQLPALAQQTGLTAEAIGTSFHTALTESSSAAQAGQTSATNIGNLLAQQGAAQAGGIIGGAAPYAQMFQLPAQLAGLQLVTGRSLFGGAPAPRP